MDKKIKIEVAYALKDKQKIIEVDVNEGTTLKDAIKISKIKEAFPEEKFLDSEISAGIFGKQKPLNTILRNGDRVEIYRNLIADPKESRKRRAEKKMKFSDKAKEDPASGVWKGDKP